MRTTTRAAACFLLVFLAALAVAQDFTTLPSEGKYLGYVATPQPGKWLVFGPGGFKPVQATVLEGGKVVLWQGDTGEYAVIYLPAGEAQPLVAVVQLGKVIPPPPPPPPLSPLAKQTRDWATTLVPTEARLKCESVAQSLDAISSRMAAGTLTDPAKIIAATRDANQAAVGEMRGVWLPFFEEVRKYLNAEAAAGRLKTLEQHQAVWKDVAAGLRAAK